MTTIPTSLSAPPLVRNLLDGPTVLSSADFKDEVRWAAKGDPSGDDFQYVDPGFLRTPAFFRALNKGIFEVVEADEEVQAMITMQADAWRKRQSHIDQQATMTIDRQTERQLANVKIDEKGNITGVPLTTGVDTSGTDRAPQTEKSIPVYIDQRQTSPLG